MKAYTTTTCTYIYIGKYICSMRIVHIIYIILNGIKYIILLEHYPDLMYKIYVYIYVCRRQVYNLL